MPFTLAHPAAVLPLRPLRRWGLVFPALVVGAMAPDFEYFLRLRSESHVGHTVAGLFLFCVPAGLLLLWLHERLVRRPLALIAPSPHREALWRAALDAPRRGAGWWLRAALSLPVGAATHLLWDSVTHADGFLIPYMPFLMRSFDVPLVGPRPLCGLLQWICSALGLAALGLAYARWLKTAPRCRPADVPRLPARLRDAARALLLAAPPGAAFLFAAATWPIYHGRSPERAFVAQFLIGWVAFTAALLLLVSCAVRLLRPATAAARRRDEGRRD